jgi:peroxiredoxin
MKKILITLLVAITFFACNKPTTYTIIGTVDIPEMEGSQVFLYMRINDVRTKIDSATIVDGMYTLTGTVENPGLGDILIGDGIQAEGQYAFWAMLIVEKGDISIITNNERVSRVSGTKNNELFQTFQNTQNTFHKEQGELWTARNEAQQAENKELLKLLKDEFEEAYSKWNTFVTEFIRDNINNVVGRSLLRAEASYLTIEQMKETISKATLKTPELVRFTERIQILEKTAIGQPFTDFRLQDLDGNEVALSDFAGKGKYVMIDFTATWCGPCIHGKPAMKKTYNQFKDNGFEIVSVWFDNDREAWANSAKELPWHHMSDLKGWDSEAGKLYAVRGIPHSVLIDQNGLIIEIDLQGDNLNKKLAELMP